MTNNADKAEKKLFFSVAIVFLCSAAYGAVTYQWILHGENSYLFLMLSIGCIAMLSIGYACKKCLNYFDALIKELNGED